MTVFFGTYDKCRCIAHTNTEGDCYDVIRKFLKDKGIDHPMLKTWVSPEKVATVEVLGADQEFYFIKADADLKDQWNLTKDVNYVSMRDWEVE